MLTRLSFAMMLFIMLAAAGCGSPRTTTQTPDSLPYTALSSIPEQDRLFEVVPSFCLASQEPFVIWKTRRPISSMTLSLYNRWGEEIVRIQNPGATPASTFPVAPQSMSPVSELIWKMEVSFPGEETMRFTGQIVYTSPECP